MNILHLEASSGWGGQEIRILREAEGMRSNGHFVLFAVQPGAQLGKKARKEGFVVYEVNYKKPWWPISIFRLFRIFRQHEVELLNTHSSLDSWLGGIAARMAGRKVVRTRHLSTPVKKGINSRLLYGKLADFVVTTCEAIIHPLIAQSGKEGQFFRSIATGVDPEKIIASKEEIAQFRSSLNIHEEEFLVGTACFMRSWKGIETFLKAADKLREIKWVIIGGGHAEKYKKMAAEMGLQDIVYFTGHLENPFPAIASLDVFLLLSTANEGVSQAILQAAFLQKPLIATPTGGSPEVCLNGITGFLVPIFQENPVIQKVVELRNNLELRVQMGQKARQLVLEQFTFKYTLDSMEKVYRTVLELRS